MSMYGNAAHTHYDSVGGGGPAEWGDKSSISCLSASCFLGNARVHGQLFH